MAVRYVRFLVPTIAAGANSGRQVISTFDDDKPRKVTGIFVANPTALLHSQLDISGVVIADIEHGDFSIVPQILPLDATYQVGVQVAITVVNGSAGAHTSPHDVVTIRYEI